MSSWGATVFMCARERVRTCSRNAFARARRHNKCARRHGTHAHSHERTQSVRARTTVHMCAMRGGPAHDRAARRHNRSHRPPSPRSTRSCRGYMYAECRRKPQSSDRPKIVGGRSQTAQCINPSLPHALMCPSHAPQTTALPPPAPPPHYRSGRAGKDALCEERPTRVPRNALDLVLVSLERRNALELASVEPSEAVDRVTSCGRCWRERNSR